MKLILPIFSLIVFFSNGIHSQNVKGKLATTDDGKQVILYENNTWGYLGDPQPKIGPQKIETKFLGSEVKGDKFLQKYLIGDKIEVVEYGIKVSSRTTKGKLYRYADKKGKLKEEIGPGELTKATIQIKNSTVHLFRLVPYQVNVYFQEDGTNAIYSTVEEGNLYSKNLIGAKFPYLKWYSNEALIGDYYLQDAIELAASGTSR